MLGICLVFTLLPGLAQSGNSAAQGFRDGLGAAAKMAEAKDWEGALELLLGLQAEAKTAATQERLASTLDAVGAALREASKLDAALRAHTAALATRRRIHGDRDDSRLADSIEEVARCLQWLGRSAEARAQLELVLAMRRRLHGDRDHPDIAATLNNLAMCHESLGRASQALPEFEEVLAMNRRLHGETDHREVANSLNSLAHCLQSLSRPAEALPRFEAALAMHRRLQGDRDHAAVALGLNNVAFCLQSLGRFDEALLHYEASLAMQTRLHGGGDHADLATGLDNVGHCLQSQGGARLALSRFEASLAMRERLYGGRDHPMLAMSLNNMAGCLELLGRFSEALPRFETSLAMFRRVWGDGDHPHVASALRNVGSCLTSLGRPGLALPHLEASLAMHEKCNGGRDHRDVAMSLNSLALALHWLGRVDQALSRLEASLAMLKRLYGDGDHPDVALMLNDLAYCLNDLDRGAESLARFEESLAMLQRLYGDRDHPRVAGRMNNVAHCLESLGRAGEALPRYEASLAMNERLYGDSDHPEMAKSLTNLGSCLASLGQLDRAASCCRRACSMIERLREANPISALLRQTLFDELKRGGAFELMQAVALRLNDSREALLAAERSRGRELLDLLEQQRFDVLLEAERLSKVHGDAAAKRLPALRAEMEAALLESDRLLHAVAALCEAPAAADSTARRQELIRRTEAVHMRRRQLLDEQARLIGDSLPMGRVRTAGEIQAALQKGELFLEFTITERSSQMYIIGPEGEIEVVSLPTAQATVQRLLPMLLEQVSRRGVQEVRGEPLVAGRPAGDAIAPWRELFVSLMPAEAWRRVRTARRVFIAAHRALHRLPFELLIIGVEAGKPVYWLDSGPEVAYVPSASALGWLRQRAKDAGDEGGELDLLAVGDAGHAEVSPAVPEEGVLIKVVQPGGQASRIGLRAGDVLVRYDGRSLVDDATLGEQRQQTVAAIAGGKRPDGPIPIEVWRGGHTRQLEISSGPLGVEVGKGKARSAYEASLGAMAQIEKAIRLGDLDRIRALPTLVGARAEVEAITNAWAERGLEARCLLDTGATETAVFDLAAKARYLHFACHGIAEEYAGQSLSMLVLNLPTHVRSGDDGLLKLDDLLHRWGGRLSLCRLVVLSACHTNVGPTQRDEVPQALPLGFLFAGASSVISSLWAVDDASTRELMTDFYQRLIAGETDRLKAFTAAKRELRKRFADPYHWAPFLYIGSPE